MDVWPHPAIGMESTGSNLDTDPGSVDSYEVCWVDIAVRVRCPSFFDKANNMSHPHLRKKNMTETTMSHILLLRTIFLSDRLK